MPDRKDFLGVGWRYPFHFTRRTGGVFRGNNVDFGGSIPHIEQSLRQILGTTIGSRVIRRDFGSEIRGIVFEPNDPLLDTEFDFMIRKAIETWEPRVIVGPISIDRTDWQRGRLEIEVTFRIIKTNREHNLVFPFFLSEGQRKTFVTPAS